MRYRQLAWHAGIYLITNRVSGKIYIGSARDLSERRRRHFGHLRTNRHFNSHLQSAWNKYGEESFTFSILLVCEKQDLVFYEQRALDVFRTLYGAKMLYNVNVLATTALGRKLSPEIRAKLSAANTRPMLGRTHTPETRLRLSIIGKERCNTLEWRERMRRQNTGRTDSPETREKRRISALARAPMADVSKEKVRASKLGKPRPPHVIAVLVALHTGKSLPAEQRAKMSAAHQARWEKATREARERAALLRSQGNTYKEIAKALQVSITSVGRYLRAQALIPVRAAA